MDTEPMRIVVPIKQVPETSAVRMDEETGTMIREGVEAIVNPLDLYAVECALQLKDLDPEHTETVAVTLGPPNAAKALREVIAMGIDSAMHVTGREFAGSDTWATSAALAAAIRTLTPFDLIVCGERATDGDTGQVGPGIAAFLDLPIVTYVSKRPARTDGVCRVERLVENGHEILDVDLPAVLTVVKEIASPRLPTLRGKQKARKAELPVLTPADLQLASDSVGLKGSPTRVVKIFRPKVARTCEKIPATDPQSIDAACERAVEFLIQQKVI